MADFILKEAATKDSYRKRMIESEFEFYTGRYLLRSIVGLFLTGLLIYISVNGDLPFWGVLSIAMALVPLTESKRNTARVDAMLKLTELDSNLSPPNYKNQQHN
tara:strand:+ start:114 stop:425 length:312 start_codon:yes stop_codon:yes gene_type:complete